MKRSGPPRRRTRLSGASERRRGEREQRQDVTQGALLRHSDRCALAHTGSCRDAYGATWRPQAGLDAHEVIRRSQRPGAHLDERLVIPLCRHHHNLDVSLDAGQAWGIRAPGWTADRYGIEAVVAELERIRRSPPGRPFWLDD